MKKIKIDYLSTLFVGIDIGSRTNVISAINFDQEFLVEVDGRNDVGAGTDVNPHKKR